MKILRFAVPALATLALFGPAAFRAVAAPAPQQGQGYGQDRDWDRPPREYNEVQRLGFHDGMQGAQRDFDNHRSPDPRNRDEYRSPHVGYRLRDAYREAFRRGYENAASRLWRTAQAAPPPPTERWEWGMRGLRSDAQRRGYQEGIEQARRDFNERRRPDPDDHREYRNPPVPPPVVEEYREGFMRGYEVALSQLNGEQPWQGGDPTRGAPQRFSELQRRGFHDGIEGAHRDADNHRQPNPANRDEYRRPNMPEQFWGEYREGFRRGYEMAVNQMYGR
jgi:hypothetical protein